MKLPPDRADGVADAALKPDIVRRHRWGELPERRLAATEFPDGNARTEKTCIHCGLVKITVHPAVGFAWREWRHVNGQSSVCEHTPPCHGEVPAL